MIHIATLPKHEFAFNISRIFGVVYIGLWFFGLTIPFRRGTVNLFRLQKNYLTLADNKCEVCHMPLFRGSLGTTARYHKKCRKFRKK